MQIRSLGDVCFNVSNKILKQRIRSLYITMIISGAKEAPLLLKTGISFFWVTRMDIDL